MADRTLHAPRLGQLVAIAVTVVLVFAVLFPFVGGFVDSTDDGDVTYTVSNPVDAPASYLITVFSKSLYLSVLTFALVGAEGLVPVGATRLLVGLEALLGVGFLALLVVTLHREL